MPRQLYWSTIDELRFLAELDLGRLEAYREAALRRTRWGELNRSTVLAVVELWIEVRRQATA